MNKKIKLFTFIFVVFGMITAVSGYSLKKQNFNTTIKPGTNAEIGTLVINNTENQSMKNVSISTYDYPFIVKNTESEQNINPNSAVKIPIKVHVPNSFVSRNVSGNIDVSGSNFNRKSVNHTFHIPAVKRWRIKDKSINETATSGTSGTIGNFTIVNNGNVDITFSLNMTGNVNKISNIQKQLQVYRGINRTMSLPYDVPTTLKQGTYNGTIQITEGNRTEIVNITTEVKDNLKPDLSNLDIVNKIQATKNFPISVLASDNIEVTNVTAKIFHHKKVVNGNNTIINKNLISTVNLKSLDNDPNQWRGTFKDTNLRGNYSVVIEAKDLSNNTANITGNFTVIGLNSINTAGSINFPAAETGVFVNKMLFTMESPTPINLTLEKGNLGSDWSIRIAQPNGNEKIISKINQTVQFENSGTYRLLYQSGETGPYSGTLNFDTIKSHVPVDDVTFTGEVVNYTVPEPYNKTWTGGSTLRCVVNNTGIQSQSYYKCTVKYSLDKTSGDELIPIPQSRLENFKESVRQKYRAKLNSTQTELQAAQGEIGSQKIQKWIAVLGLIIVVGYGIIEIRYLPKIRFKVV